MAKQISAKVSRAATRTQMAAVQLDESINVQPDTVQIVNWLSRLHLLYGIPFNYLVPDIRMLPDESIRFFQVDNNWITALIDGAFSLGETISTYTISEAMRPQIQAYVNSNLGSVRAAMLEQDSEQTGPAHISGFFLRSSAVSGWPGMEITGYSDTDGQHQLGILRLERISPSLLLCLFNGSIAKVEIREPSETLHFKFDVNSRYYTDLEDITDDYYEKRIRYVNSGGDVTAGSYASNYATVCSTVMGNKVVYIDSLAQAMNRNCWAPGTPESEQTFTSAEFGLTMVQETDYVTFQINPQNEQA
jgi:hypothetical protein